MFQYSFLFTILLPINCFRKKPHVDYFLDLLQCYNFILILQYVLNRTKDVKFDTLQVRCSYKVDR